MKRIPPYRNFRLAALAAKRWRTTLLRRNKTQTAKISDQPSMRPELRLAPPSNFSFSTNYIETVSFLRNFKEAVLKGPQKSRPRVFIDLAEIKTITLAGALVLAAEIYRWRKHSGVGLVARNTVDWDPEVRRQLSSIGFFRLLHVNLDEKFEHDSIPAHVTVLPMISSTVLDQELLHKTLELLADAARILDQDPLVYGALVEAAYNAKLHAYPDNYDYEFPPVVKGWWATAGWMPQQGCVKFLVYDQGVGIPSTLPRWSGWEKIRATMVSIFGESVGQAMKDSSNLIEAAIQLDRTSLDGGHGKGLQDVVAVVESVPGASVRILSGTGRVIYHHDGRTEKRDEPLHIGGTLIEWTIPVGSHDGR